MTDNKEITLIVKKVYQDKKVVKYLGDFKNERKIQMKLCKNAAKYTKASNPQGFVILPVNCYKRVLYRGSYKRVRNPRDPEVFFVHFKCHGEHIQV